MKGKKICKVCGKEYEYCHTNRPSGTFRYQDVACCPEHGSIYLAQIIASRSKNEESVADESTEEPVEEVVEDDYIDDDDDIETDDWYNDDEDDDDDEDEYEEDE